MTKQQFTTLQQIDAGIRNAVRLLWDQDVQTVQACEGGDDHSTPYPFIDFRDDKGEEFRVLGICLNADLPVIEVTRTYEVHHGTVSGPWYRIEFAMSVHDYRYLNPKTGQFVEPGEL